MAENNENNTKLISIGSTSLVKVSNTMAITQKILKEVKQKIDPLVWWNTVDDDMKMVFYANFKYSEEIKVPFENQHFYFLDKIRILLEEEIETIRNLDKETIKSILNFQFFSGGKFTLSNIMSIKELTNLTELYLYFNKISDITPLVTLTNLTKLILGSNKISDISSLSTLTNLTYLNLCNNKISDVRPLSKLTNLQFLNLRENEMLDIRPLSTLTKLTTLVISENKIADIRPLVNLTNLTYLYLRENEIIDEQIAFLKIKLPNCKISQ